MHLYCTLPVVLFNQPAPYKAEADAWLSSSVFHALQASLSAVQTEQQQLRTLSLQQIGYVLLSDSLGRCTAIYVCRQTS